MIKFRVVDIITNKVIGTFDNDFDARDFCNGRGNCAVDFVEVDDEGFEMEGFYEDYEPADIDDDFGFDPYMGEYTYDC